MKELNIEIAVKIYDYEELDAADRELMDAAREATNRSYAPYSHFSVGAAARLANGIVVTGRQLTAVMPPIRTSRWAQPLGWQTISSLPEPIRRMQPIRRGFARNAPLCSMPTPNIPTRLWRHLP